MNLKLKTVDSENFYFVPTNGRLGDRSISHGLDVPSDATKFRWYSDLGILKCVIPAQKLPDGTELSPVSVVDIAVGQYLINSKLEELLSPPPLEKLKSLKIDELKAQRWAAEVSGITVPMYGEIFTDKETQSELSKAVTAILAGSFSPIDWGFPNGAVVRLGETEIRALHSLVFTHVQATRTQFSERLSAVVSATNEEELNAITW